MLQVGAPTRRDDDQDDFIVVFVEQDLLLVGGRRRDGEGQERARAEGQGPAEVGAGKVKLTQAWNTRKNEKKRHSKVQMNSKKIL